MASLDRKGYLCRMWMGSSSEKLRVKTTHLVFGICTQISGQLQTEVGVEKRRWGHYMALPDVYP